MCRGGLLSEVCCTLVVFCLFTLLRPAFVRAQWQSQIVPGDATMLLSIDFSDSMNGMAGGYSAPRLDFSGRAVYTTDGSANWSQSVVPESTRTIVVLKFVGHDTALALGSYNLPGMRKRHGARIAVPLAYGCDRCLRLLGIDGTASYSGYELKTTNGGQSWFQYGTLPKNISYLFAASFVTSQLGYATGDTTGAFGGPRVLKTTNGGLSWKELVIPDSIVYLPDICFVDSVLGVAVGYMATDSVSEHGIIIRTTDGGTTWSLKHFPAMNNFTSVSFSNGLVGYATGPSNGDSVHPVQGLLYKTTDAGESWTEVQFPWADSIIFSRVKFAWGTDVGIVYGSGHLNYTRREAFIARTTNGGESWALQTVTVASSGTMLWGGTLLTALDGYLTGGDVLTSSVILHTSNGGANEVEKWSEGIPRIGQLEQNYPNPFNPNTKISYQLPVQSHVTLKVFDVLGREAATLVNGVEEPGYKSVRFDASGLSSGIYFYRLRTGNYIQTKKLLLLR